MTHLLLVAQEEVKKLDWRHCPSHHLNSSVMNKVPETHHQYILETVHLIDLDSDNYKNTPGKVWSLAVVLHEVLEE